MILYEAKNGLLARFVRAKKTIALFYLKLQNTSHRLKISPWHKKSAIPILASLYMNDKVFVGRKRLQLSDFN